ncbi:M15 family metallopeptidase [Candidatus Regiella endosymbiont of Tuberolachnus salignus]|uniref:M15 family metallopeptidase n=1 Tax=Candidatus Regiella endosymbiont of Tuberolachnus salignus TaxID=3077956 RepID=UPI0030D00ADE
MIMVSSCIASDIGIFSFTPEECTDMQTHNVITPKNPVACDRLRRVRFEHIDFEGKTTTGNIVVLDAVANQVEKLFSKLFELRFPIKKAVVMESYEGNDKVSMSENNTSAFNGRPITNGDGWSKHAYGVAIDLNPLQNPYISFDDEGNAQILPPASAKFFVNRNDVRPNKEKRAGLVEDVVEIFAQHGFMIWGGNWNYPIDYQHFEIGSQKFIDNLLSQTPDAAREAFDLYAQHYRDCIAQSREIDPVRKHVICVEKVQKEAG